MYKYPESTKAIRVDRVPHCHGISANVTRRHMPFAEVGDIQRFKTQHHFASYCGAAPVPRESGASEHVRVNRGGNRRLNWALHIIARTRLRIDETSQTLVARKEQEGKTHREAIRILKTYLARQLYRTMRELLTPRSRLATPS